MTTDIQKAAGLFKNLKAAPKAKAPAKSGKTVREEIELGIDLDYIAAAGVVMKALEGVSKTLRAEMIGAITGIFAEKMIKTRSKPEAFIGVGGEAKAYIGVTRKGSNRPLDPETVDRLDAMGVPMTKVEKMPDRLIINPDLLNDQETLKVLADLIADHPKLKDVPVILHQEGESGHVTNDETLPALARLVADETEAADLLTRVAGFTIGKFQVGDSKEPGVLMRAALRIISGAKMLGGAVEETA
jgi:hypothetical protein